jgi:regulator of sirC expression with transglutaminase-like and TPR domain
MSLKLPLCCSPVAFSLLIRQMPRIDTPEALVYGAAAIAAHQLDDSKPAEVEAKLQRYADTVRARVRGDQPQALVAHLHEFLFEEEGFCGNNEDYYNPLNSYLPAVLENKRGLPILLGLIYKSVAERLGLKVWGVGMPGHFIVALDMDPMASAPMLVDPFASGRVMTYEEAHERLKAMLGPDTEWSDDLVNPVSNRLWLTRILQNLLTVFGSSGHYSDVAAVLEMEMVLWPDQDRLQRDLALVLARIGLAQPASAWLNQYLKNNPDDPQKGDLRQLLAVLET